MKEVEPAFSGSLLPDAIDLLFRELELLWRQPDVWTLLGVVITAETLVLPTKSVASPGRDTRFVALGK